MTVISTLRQELPRRGLPPAIAGDLAGRLAALLAAGSLGERLDALVRLVRWLRQPAPDGNGSRGRADLLVELLEGWDALRSEVQQAVAAVVEHSRAVGLFGEAGIPGERGLVAEALERLMDHALPAPREDRELASLLRRLFPSSSEVDRFAGQPHEVVGRLGAALLPDPDTPAGRRLRGDFDDALRLLAARVQAQGLAERLRQRSRPGRVSDSPFVRLQRATDAFLEAASRGEPDAAVAEAWSREVAACREEMVEIERRLETDGVSLDIVYGLEVIERCLVRMERMVGTLLPSDRLARATAFHELLAQLVRYSHQDRSVLHLLGWNLRLLARKIVERSSATGEHYIAATLAQYRHVWLAAAGGGVLTAFTAALKLEIHHWPVSDFAHGLLYGLNYAVSFLMLQAFGLILATKQPAMTAAALATILRERSGPERREEVVAYVARICYSQLAAALGNVIVVAAAATALVGLWQLATGNPLLAREDAAHVFAELSPVNSGTVFYAALTGVLLWLGSLAGGWFENFCVFHRLPRVLAEHPLGRKLGRQRMVRAGEALAHNSAGWGTNVALGFLLGMTPAVGAFLGLPLDVRHVTLNTGILAVASASLGHDWYHGGWFLLGVAGIAVMFALNLSVSFLLSLFAAARAYGLPRREVTAILRELTRRFASRPFDFLLPPLRHSAVARDRS